MEVSLYSVCKHLGKENVTFYIMKSNWSDEDTQSFQETIGKDCSIIYINIEKTVFDGIRNTKGLPIETLFRLYGIEQLPLNVHRILYLDIDILCVSESIKTLFDNLLDDKFKLAAVPDAGIPDKYEANIIGDNALMHYFNAGVLFINVDYCREIGLWDLSQKYLSNEDLIAVDQDILNIIFKDDYYCLSHRYNYMSPQIFKDMLFYRKNTVIKNSLPILIHFDGPHKPWYPLCANPYKDVYKEIVEELGVQLKIPFNKSFIYKFKLLLQYIKIVICSK